LIDGVFSLRQERGTDYALSMRDRESPIGFQYPSAVTIERQPSDFQYQERWRFKKQCATALCGEGNHEKTMSAMCPDWFYKSARRG
jgi:hypothetical protein